MPRLPLLETLDAVERWVSLNPGKIVWCYRDTTGVDKSRKPAKGPTLKEAWRVYSTAAALPVNRRLLIRLQGTKGGAYVELQPRVVPASSALGPTLAQEREQLEHRAAELAAEHERLKTWRAELEQQSRGLGDFERSILQEQRNVLQQQGELARLLDSRALSIAKSLEELEKGQEERAEARKELLEALDNALARANEVAGENATANAITFAIDRVLASLQMLKVNSLSDIPPEMKKDFDEFMRWRASKRYIANLPDTERVWCADFLAMPPPLQARILQACADGMQAQHAQREADRQAEQAASGAAKAPSN